MKIYSKVLANLFFLFFTSIVLSPAVGDKTLYLYWIIPILDLKFFLFLKNKKLKLDILIILFFIFILLLIYNQYINILKILLIIYTLLYLLFQKKQGNFYLLYKYMNLNIIIAIFQFIFGYISFELAYKIGPSNIAKIVWGKLATATFTNFYSIGLLKRASGLSREVGFFASLLIITIILYYEDKTIRKNKWQYYFWGIGYLIGFSKMSFILPVYFILKKIKKYINIVQLSIINILLLLFLIIISNYLYKIGYFNSQLHETWIHRLSGYHIISNYNIINFIYPLETILDIYKKYTISYLRYIVQFEFFTGLSHIVLHMGILTYILFLILLKRFKIESFSYLMLVLLCFNTNLITTTSYIILNYYFILRLGEKYEK